MTRSARRAPSSRCRIFTCVGFMAGWVACVQIARLWRAGGLACLRIVPCEHFPQEDPGGTAAGRPGSSPPAPATHSAGADHPRLPEPSSGASLFRKLDAVAVPAARLLPAPGSTSAISRRSPAAASAPGCRRCSARRSCVGTRARAGRPGQAAARPSGGPPDPASPRGARHQHKHAHKGTPQLPAPNRRNYNQ